MTLKLKPLAIGSLPHENAQEALDYVFNTFSNTPFWPQLGKVDKKEDMIAQYTQNVAGIIYDELNNKYIFSMETKDFCDKLEELYLDYEMIVSEKDFSSLDKYAITSPYSCSIQPFLNRIAKTTPSFAKGHVTGSFTWGAAIVDNQGRCAFFDPTARDILTKGLALKAIWQIKEIKKHSPSSKPIIFIDEPALCQCGTSAFVTVQREEILDSLKEIVNAIQSNGALCAIHCCGKADWEMVLKLGVDIINLDAFLYAQSLSLYHKKIEEFLTNGGYIAWGAIPTLDKEALENITLEKTEQIFENAVKHLETKGINRELVINHSLITPSCGAGGLTIELAQKAMEITVKLSDVLSKKYGVK